MLSPSWDEHAVLGLQQQQVLLAHRPWSTTAPGNAKRTD